MTTWNCAVIGATSEVDEQLDRECGVARAVGVVDCPQCGTVRAPFRENGEGVVFEFTELRGEGLPEFEYAAVDMDAVRRGEPAAVVARERVRDDDRSGNTEVPERTEGKTNAEDQ